MRTHPHKNISCAISLCIKEFKFIQGIFEFFCLLFFIYCNCFCFFFCSKDFIWLFFFHLAFALCCTFHHCASRVRSRFLNISARDK